MITLLLNILLPGTGLIVRRREWLGLSLVMLYGICANVALADRWIVSRLNRTVSDATRLFEAFQYGEAGRQLYEFFWSEFADWYVEIAKGQIDQAQSQSFATSVPAVWTELLSSSHGGTNPPVLCLEARMTPDLERDLARGSQLTMPEALRHMLAVFEELMT